MAGVTWRTRAYEAVVLGGVLCVCVLGRGEVNVVMN